MRANRSIPSNLYLTETPLPDPGLALAVHAHDLTELGAWLLAACDAALLSVTLCAEERDPAAPVMLWNSRRLPDDHLARTIAAPTYRFRSVVKAMEQAADALFEALSPRWPASTPPPRLGVITDGTGLGFCPDDPSPLAPGWMTRRARDARCLTCLLPFSPHSGWAVPTRSPA